MFYFFFLLLSEDYGIMCKKKEKHIQSHAFIVPLFESTLLSKKHKDEKHGDIGAFNMPNSAPVYSKDTNKCPPETNPMPSQCVITPLSPPQQNYQPPQQNYQPPQQVPQYTQAYMQPILYSQPQMPRPIMQNQQYGNMQQPQYTMSSTKQPPSGTPISNTTLKSGPSRIIGPYKDSKETKDTSKDKPPTNNAAPLPPGVVKRTVSTVTQKCDSVTPLDTIRGIDPNLAVKLEKIFDYQGHTTIPWDITEDLKSTNQHPMPNWCLLYQKARDAISVFHQVKDIIGSMISDITTYQRRAKEYLKEIAGKLSKNVLKMSDDLEKVRRSKDMTMRNYFMKDFTSLECSSHALIVKYKKLKSWLSHVVKGFTGLFLPLYTASGARG